MKVLVVVADDNYTPTDYLIIVCNDEREAQQLVDQHEESTKLLETEGFAAIASEVVFL